VYEQTHAGAEISAGHDTPGILAEEMKRILPSVQYSSSFFDPMVRSFQANNKTIKERGSFAGADFFKMFSYPLVLGNKETALNSPKDIVISREMAKAFFGSPEKAIGKTIRLESRKDFQVSAVFETLPKNASSKFEYIINWQAAIEDNKNIQNWENHGFYTFIKLREGTDPEAFGRQITNFLGRYTTFNDLTICTFIRTSMLKVSWMEAKSSTCVYSVLLQ
jgi:hypothetical protein